MYQVLYLWQGLAIYGDQILEETALAFGAKTVQEIMRRYAHQGTMLVNRNGAKEEMMAFRDTQLGRFGNYGVTLKAHTHDDPDQQAAHLYASNGTLLTRHVVQDILRRKGMWDQGVHPWTAWRTQFDHLRSNSPYSPYINPLQASCTSPSPRCPRYPHQDNCWHELIPPQEHYNLQGFSQQILPTLNNNLILRPDGTLGLPTDLWPIWNFVVTQEGEILLSQEDFGISNSR